MTSEAITCFTNAREEAVESGLAEALVWSFQLSL
jgi:hypothetical protein